MFSESNIKDSSFKQKIKEAAIVVASPFQALCAMEAVKQFCIEKPHFYAYESENSLKKTHDFIVSQGFECEDLEDVSGTYNIIRYFKKRNCIKYDYIFSGDYFSKYCFIVCLLWSKPKAHIVYLDDGNSTLTLLPPLNKKRFKDGSIAQRIIYQVLLLYSRRVGLKRLFFTIYDVEGKGFPYSSINNKFSNLVGVSYSKKSGVYVIGTISSKTKMDKNMYCNYLSYIKRYSEEQFPQEDVFYCPHRSDTNCYNEECEQLGIKIFNSRVSVEVDFVSNHCNPVAVFGFGSTALLTLKIIFSDSQIIDIPFNNNCLNDEDLKSYRQIEREYQEKGISVMEINI